VPFRPSERSRVAIESDHERAAPGDSAREHSVAAPNIESQPWRGQRETKGLDLVGVQTRFR
jgi:hypothetical protein